MNEAARADEERRLKTFTERNNWEGDLYDESRSRKEIAKLLREDIRRAIKDGSLPGPDDYRVAAIPTKDYIRIYTDHYGCTDGRLITRAIRKMADRYNFSRTFHWDSVHAFSLDFTYRSSVNTYYAAAEKSGDTSLDWSEWLHEGMRKKGFDMRRVTEQPAVDPLGGVDAVWVDGKWQEE